MKWQAKSAELKEDERKMRTKQQEEDQAVPHRWFAWKPVRLSGKSPDKKLHYVWFERVWRWKEHRSFRYSLKEPGKK